MWYKIENNTLFLCELLHKKGVFVTFSEMRGEKKVQYKAGGSANSLIAMGAKSGTSGVAVYPPSGWYIGKAVSQHTINGVVTTLAAYS